MGLIKKGIEISKTIRNVGRLREIVLVFGKQGFAEFISRGITSKIPNFVLPKSSIEIKEELALKAEGDWPKIIGQRLRMCFEELGPVFVKFGQLLSSREDIFDSSFTDELKMLRNQVKGVPYDQVKSAIEESLGAPIDSVFSEFDSEPIGTASIGVVHKAVLRAENEEVVVKIRRPGIIKQVEADVSALLFLANQVEKVSEEIRAFGISRIVSDFAVSLQNEINFNIESLNCHRFKLNLKHHDHDNIFYIPKIYNEYLTEDLLVMELVKGISFTDNKLLEPELEKLQPTLEEGIQVVVKTFLQDGFFHADLHGGNFFLMENGQIALVDFGLMGNLSKRGRINFTAIIYALLSYNYENLVYEFLDVAEYDTIPDVDELVRDVRISLSPYLGLTVGQTNFPEALQSMIKAMGKHQLYLPREWFIILRALITLDGVGRSIGIDVNLYEILNRDIKEILKTSVNKEEILEDAVWGLRDILTSARVIPRHIKWYIKKWAKKKYVIEMAHPNLEFNIYRLTNSITFVGLCLVASIMIFSGVFLLDNHSIGDWVNISIFSWIFWGLGALIFLHGSLKVKKKRGFWNNERKG